MNVDRIKQLDGEDRRAGYLPSAVEIAANVCGRPPLFTLAYSPKAPQKWLEGASLRRKYRKLLALPRGLEPLFSP
jgi:hypothetical protein